MGIALAVDAVGAKNGGGATVLRDVVEASLASPRVGRLTVFCSPRRLRNFDLPRDSRLDEIEVPWAESGRLARIVWLRRGLAAAARRARADVLLCLSGGGIPPCGIAAATLIQQALPFSAEAQARLSPWTRVRVATIRRCMRASTRCARLVIVQTPTMRRWVTDAFRLDPDRVAVVEPDPILAKGEGRAAVLRRMRDTPPNRRLLYVGNTAPHKNISMFPEGMRALRQRFPDAMLFATIPEDHPISRADGIHALGSLSPSVLREAYELACAVVLPSVVETVGLPLLEAATLGTPAIVADRPYAHDVCGEGALYFDPLIAGDLAEKAGRLLGDGVLRRELEQASRRRAEQRSKARPYERMVNMVLDLVG